MTTSMNKATKYLTATKRTLAAAVMVIATVIAAVAQVPNAPNPPRLVNDFAGIFTPQQVQEMEDSLVLFARKTSNQIAVVTMTDLGGMEPAQMAYEIGEKWGVGGKADRNGVVILVKPKTDTRGQVFIATGYGLEGALPDATCKKIVERCMIPHFKHNDYYGGVVEALSVIKPIAAGEYSKEQLDNDDDELIKVLALLFLLCCGVIVFAAILGNKNNGGKNSGTMGSGGVFFGPTIFGSGSGSRSSGFGGGGGGFGGFGGFGGGSFGGGGAGGSW
ncbi:MAG: TPM domain-containing protein [Muribaculaceae bacterium]